MTEQNPDLLALREGLPEGPWKIAHHAYLPDGDWAAIYTSDPDLPAVFAPGRVARAIAAIPSMLAENERLYGVVENKNEAWGLLNDEVEQLRARNTEMREALKVAHGVLVTLVKPDPKPAALVVFAQAVEAETKVRAILVKTETPE